MAPPTLDDDLGFPATLLARADGELSDKAQASSRRFAEPCERLALPRALGKTRDNEINVASLSPIRSPRRRFVANAKAGRAFWLRLMTSFELGRRLNGKHAELTGSSRRCHTVA